MDWALYRKGLKKDIKHLRAVEQLLERCEGKIQNLNIAGKKKEVHDQIAQLRKLSKLSKAKRNE